MDEEKKKITIKERYSKTLCNQTVQYIRQKPSYFLLTIVYDIIFLLLLFVFNKLQSVIFPAQFAVSTFGFITLLLISLIIITVIYTFTKLILLQIIDSFEKKLEISFKKSHLLALFHFFFFGISFLIFIFINYIIEAAVKQQLITILQLIILTPLFILLGLFLQLMQNYFLQTRSIKQAMKDAFKAFGNSRIYVPLIYCFLINFLLLIILSIILAIINQFYLKDHQDYLLYMNVSVILFSILLIINYLYFTFARVSYNRITNK